MAGNDLAMRFTEEKYATKNEVARELKISSVDTFWANILAYRSNFYHYLTVRTIEKKMLLLFSYKSPFVIMYHSMTQVYNQILTRTRQKQCRAKTL